MKSIFNILRKNRIRHHSLRYRRLRREYHLSFSKLHLEETSKRVNTLSLAWSDPQKSTSLSTFQLMDEEGNILNKKDMPEISQDKVLDIYKKMVLLNQMDTICYSIQRQGVISFYMTNLGEEATQYGSAAAFEIEDVVFGQYREAGVLHYRGFTLDQFLNQLFSNHLDSGKGRQMPVHYGDPKLNFQTISSPLATQIPQASGSAYALARMGKKNCVVCYFGEGAASEGDFHPAMNFAVTLDCPVVFICRNNKYAISTPTKDQYRGDGIAGRGVAYGMNTIRVDGNDFFAVLKACQKARSISVNNSLPVIIEAMTYRIGHHSTSDDSERYRSNKEIEKWSTTGLNPIIRLKRYLIKSNQWTEEQDSALKEESKNQVIEAIQKAQVEKKANIKHLFTDVFEELPPHLQEQQRELDQHLSKYKEHYRLDEFSEKL